MARQEVWSPESSEGEGEEQSFELGYFMVESRLDSAKFLLPGMFNTIFACSIWLQKCRKLFRQFQVLFFTVNLKE